MGRQISYTDVWGDTTTSTYDQAGRLVQSSGPAGLQSYGYDVAGHLSSEAWTQAGGAALTSDVETFSQAGRATGETVDGASASSAFTYDAAGRLTGAVLPGEVLAYSYASSGGCGSLAGAGLNSNRTAMTVGAASYSYCYDGADELTSSTDPNVSVVGYDSHGEVSALGGQLFGYDGRGDQISAAGGAGGVGYVRDSTGRVVARIQGGVTTRYGFTGSGGPSLVLDADDAVVQRTIGLAGGVIVTKQDSGDVWSYPNASTAGSGSFE